MNSSRLLPALILIILTGLLRAAPPSVSADSAWTTLDSTSMAARSIPSARKWIFPDRFAAFTINEPVVRSQAFSAPPDNWVSARNSITVITVPRPDGTYERFSIVDVPTMEPGLAARYPDIRTFSGVGLDDPSATVRGDIGPQGFRASVRNDSDWYYVDPYWHGNTDVHVSYYLKDSGEADLPTCDFVHDHTTVVPDAVPAETADAFGTDFRTVRLALSTTGEYSATIDGTVAGTQAAIVSIVNRVNQIFEAEIAVRLILVNNNDTLINLNAGTDPFTDNDTEELIDENQAFVDSTLGGGNYDVSEVLNSTGSGLAAFTSVCNGSNKGRGTSSIRGGSPLDNQSVYHTAHELAHQFGAGHSWSGVAGNCTDGNWSADDSYEPGSGSTIMGYPGTCSTDNVRIGKEAYFHRRSLDTMFSFVAGSMGCATNAPSGNTPPVVNAGTDIYVPFSTPFKLKANASDTDGDTIFYCWEQFDKAPTRRALGTADDGTGPLFRSMFPTSNPARYFPANPAAPTDSEVLPTVAADRLFFVTARDFRTGGGGTNDDSMIVHVIDETPSPLQVTVGNTPQVWTGSTREITWAVGGTDTLPYNIFNVNIMLSVDGGNSYPHMLAENTPNDGSEVIALPNVITTQARIRVEPYDSGVYDISDANVTLGGHIEINPAVGDFGLVCPTDRAERTIEVFNTGNADLTITDIVHSGSSAYSMVPSNASPRPNLPVIIQPGNHVNFTIKLLAPATPGDPLATFTFHSNDPAQPTMSINALATVGAPAISTFIADGGSFGKLCVGSIKDLPLTINNTGTCDLTINNIASSSVDFIVPSVVTFPIKIQEGTSVEVPIRFRPTSQGAKGAVITLSTNAPGSATVNVNVFGTAPGGRLIVTPCPLDFGVVCLDAPGADTKDVTVCNLGLCPVNVSSVTISGADFTLIGIPPMPITVPVGTCYTFQVKFTPTSVGPKSATLTITSDDPINPVIACTITGETVESTIGTVSRIAFQPTVIASVAECAGLQPLAIVNNGLCNAEITTVTISGINADSFTLVGLPTADAGLKLAPGEQLGDGALHVKFQPGEMITERFHQAQVNVTFINDPHAMTEVTRVVPLAGEATQTGFRVLVRAGGVPVDNVVQIKAKVRGVAANGKKQKSNLRVKNATLRTVTAPDPFASDLSFQYHGEFGALTNASQLPTGEVQLRVTIKVGKHKRTQTIRFLNMDACTFNQNIVVDF